MLSYLIYVFITEINFFFKKIQTNTILFMFYQLLQNVYGKIQMEIAILLFISLTIYTLLFVNNFG